MAGVYFIVVSGKDGATVRHIQLDRADEGDRQMRTVSVRVPVVDVEGRKAFEIKVYDHLFAAIDAIRNPYRLEHALTSSPYEAALALCPIMLG